MKILVTGAAGFIGFHTANLFLSKGHAVVGVDNLNPYYDIELKKARVEQLRRFDSFEFSELDLSDRKIVDSFFSQHAEFDAIIHLAAQAGVRHSLTHPYDYVDSNITGFLTVLENARNQAQNHKPPHLVYASTSSVYGLNQKLPFSTHDSANHPVSLYAATKRANELMAHSYSHLFQIPTTGLRFFTVYGPWGRPDMALFKFTRSILEGETIDVYNEGNHIRDFTYIDDIVDGIFRVVDGGVPKGDSNWDPQNPDPSFSSAAFRVYNIGNHRHEKLLRYISVIEECLGKKAKMNLLPLQPGDMHATESDIEDLQKDFGYQPQTTIDEGVKKFVAWYREFYQI